MPLKLFSAGAGWMLALGLMVLATITDITALRGWSLLVALVAWVPTLLLVIERDRARELDETMDLLEQERRRTERLIQAVAVQFAEAELPRVGERSF